MPRAVPFIFDELHHSFASPERSPAGKDDIHVHGEQVTFEACGELGDPYFFFQTKQFQIERDRKYPLVI